MDRTVLSPPWQPLVGREKELSQLAAALSASPCATVVIAGPAGVGKSRLAGEVAEHAMAEGRPVARVIGTQSAIPFGPFAALLPDSTTSSPGSLELMQTLARAVADRAQGDQPLLLFVDDAHLLDEGSAALVRQLAEGGTCGLLVTVRTPDISPEPVIGLWKDGPAVRLDISPLSREDHDRLVEACLGGPVSGSALEWLWRASAGNPLFVRELLVGAGEVGDVYLQDGIWFLRLPLQAPARLSDLIASRLSRVAPKTAQLIDFLSIGEPLGFDILAALAGEESLEDAEGRGLIAVHDDAGRSEVRLSHPLYGEVLRQRIPRARLRRLSTSLAEAMEATGARRRDDVMRIGRWRLDAGTFANPELLELAARRARSVRDFPLAARLARAATSAGGGITAGLVLAETEFAAGRHAEADTVLLKLEGECRTDEERALIANARSYNLGMLMGDLPAATEVISEALSVIKEPAARDRLLVRQAINDVYSGSLTAALSETEELLRSDDEPTLLRGSYARALALALMGRTTEAVSVAYKAMDLHRRRLAEQPEGLLAAFQPPEAQLVGAVVGHLLSGDLSSAQHDANVAYNHALETGDKEFQATFCILRGWVLLQQGRMVSSARAFKEGAAINRDLSDVAPLRWCVAGAALAEAMSGNTSAALAAQAELSELPAHWMVALDPHLVERARAWVLVASGELTAARLCLSEIAAEARSAGHLPAEAVALHDLVRLGEATEVADRLAELVATVDGRLVAAFAAHGAAGASRDGAGLQVASAEFEAMGALVLAAEAAHEAALTYQAKGEDRKASRMAREVERLTSRCEDHRSPLLVGSHAIEPLTRREMEIARLAGTGMSSKAIAEKLYVSVRTVDNHLQHIYSKLGVNTRAGVRAALQEPAATK